MLKMFYRLVINQNSSITQHYTCSTTIFIYNKLNINLMNLFKLNTRDYIGIVGWLIVSIVIGLIAEVIMIAREYYQWKHYGLTKFEIEDVIRYSIVITIGTIININLIKLWIL